ncbi:hypothetical protein RUM44_010784 [Polyplax serrata]|uniref:Major facilitator superfamily (MFS) profile domain-containing protein n=1 Tax=Polyplax serrata TaxID=468196 RepID=A0ABR1AN60_POLSC
MEKSVESVKTKKWPQFLVLILCNISVLSFGLQTGWLSPLQPSFMSENSPLGIPPLTVEEISWIGSLPSVSLVLASPFFGYCLNKFGRKVTCLIATVPNLLHYFLLLFTKNVYLIYLARLIGGFCSCGGFIMAPIYINEVTETHLRGLLGGLLGFIIKVGIILSYVLGTYTSYTTLNIISSSFTVFFILCYKWMPESPVYLLTKNKREEAKMALIKLRGSDQKLIERELLQMEQLTEGEKTMHTSTYKNLFRTPETARALIIVCGIYTFQMMCGYPAIVRYSVSIFQSSSSELSPNVGAIMVAVSQLVSSLIGANLIDKIGRKSMLMISTFFMGVNLVVFSTYMFGRSYFQDLTALRFIPNVTLILFICSYALGYGSVPFVILPELFAPEARAKASTVSNLWISLIEFLTVKMFPTISEYIGLAPTLLIFACHCAIGLIFFHFVLFETKGLEFDEIYNKLKNMNSKRNNLEKEILKPLRYNNDLESK